MVVEDTARERERVRTAIRQTVAQLQSLYQQALPEVGPEGAAIFETHQLMAEDEDFRDAIDGIIDAQSVNAEHAVSVAGEQFAKMFSQMKDPYMRERAADVCDISGRIIDCLCGGAARVEPQEPAIIAADDFTPGDIIRMDKAKILAIATSGGSDHSHTAILLRTAGIPAIVGLGDALSADMQDATAILDGFDGKLYIEPDQSVHREMTKIKRRGDEQKILLEQYKGKSDITLDGRNVLICSNIGSTAELSLALQNDSGGVGLFRTESLFLGRDRFPAEQEQFEVYKTAVQAMAGKRVVFRTLDIGADKQPDYFDFPIEANPALGLRGIRFCIEHPDIFATQLRALLRASAFGQAMIMFPMISSAWELTEAKSALEDAKSDLTARGEAFDTDIECGIMIETPAAAIISDTLAHMVDFFSVGTNDLTQYTLAADRQNQNINRYRDPHHPAILRMIELTAQNAHSHGKWVGICGELAEDLSLTEKFLRMGIDWLSVTPAKTLELRRHIRGMRL